VKRILRSIVLATSLCVWAASGTHAEPDNAPAAQPWTCSASVFLYLVPDEDNFLQPTVAADHKRLHLEARYNYENLETASLWAGYNFEFGDDVSLAFTPMLGLVFGETKGAAPGGNLSLAWKTIAFYSECEYVVDLDVKEDSFFFSWSELTVSPTSRLRVGLVAQRTQAYETPREFQGGPLLGVRVGPAEVAGYLFDLDLPHPTYVVSVSAEF